MFFLVGGAVRPGDGVFWGAFVKRGAFGRTRVIRCGRSGRQSGGGGEDRGLACVESGSEEEGVGDAADDLSEAAGFVWVQWACEEGLLAFAEPLLQDLLTAESVVPDFDGDGGQKESAFR